MSRKYCAKKLHDWTRENTTESPDGKRRCRLCKNASARRRWRKDPEAARAALRERKRRRYVPKTRDRQEHLETLAKARQVNRDLLVPASKVKPLVEWMIGRWGIIQTSQVLGVAHQTVYNILRGRPVRRTTARKIVDVINYQAARSDQRKGERVAA